jgi:Na+-driven multidrug efflux pump
MQSDQCKRAVQNANLGIIISIIGHIMVVIPIVGVLLLFIYPGVVGWILLIIGTILMIVALVLRHQERKACGLI